ncbi:MAG: 4-hydroxy-tetrahydrodipicolinate synthase [Paenibacillaceae bacterium]
MDFGRLVTAMVTPFGEDLQVNWPQVEVLIDYLIEVQKSDSIVICGTTGESPTLTEEEKLRLFEVAVKCANGRCKIIAGTGSYATASTIYATQQAEKIGVDGILLVAPYYNRPSQEGLYQHFKAVAAATKLPIMLYNVPHRTGISVSYETTVRLAQIPNIVASKEAHADLDHMTQIIMQAPEHFRVYSGDDSLTLPVMAIGGYGIVSVASHIIGAEIKQMITYFLQGENAKATQLHAHLFPVFKGIFRMPNPAPIKHALIIKGLNVGGVRLPLVDVTDKEEHFLKSLMDSLETIKL